MTEQIVDDKEWECDSCPDLVSIHEMLHSGDDLICHHCWEQLGKT